MKVLYINAVKEIGSTGRNYSQISRYLKEHGESISIAYSYGKVGSNEISDCDSYKIGTNFEKKVHALCSRIFGLQGYFSYFSTKKLLKYIDTFNPDIVQLGNLHSNYINIKLLLKYLAEKDIITIVDLHDCWFFTGRCTHYTVTNCYKWQTECKNCPRLKKDNNSWFFDFSKKMYKDKKKLFNSIPRLIVIGVSDWIINEAKRSFLSNSKSIVRIYNWVDFKTFRPVNVEHLKNEMNFKNKFIILSIASEWSNDKGLDKFIELSEIVGDDMKVVLVGNIDKEIIENSKIINIPSTNNIKRLVEYYCIGDVFVNFSIEETFGKVSAEALACGLPILTFNSTANSELVGNDCGYVVDDYDVRKFYEYIKKVKEHGKEYYTKNCINFAKKNFNMDLNIKKYYYLYKKELGDIK